MTVLLIGGTSHVGKTRFAVRLAEAIDCEAECTDRLGRHPGRPWPSVKPHVAEFWRALSTEAIDAFLLDHHENLWTAIRAMMAVRIEDGRPWVLEGAALRPEHVFEMLDHQVDAAWLVARPEAIRARIGRSAARAGFAPDLLDAFTERSLRDNDRLGSEARRLGLRIVDAESASDLDALSSYWTARARTPGGPAR